MEKKYNQCNPTICGEDILSRENIYMTKEIIKTLCVCENKGFCLHVDDLLKNGHLPEAKVLMNNIDINGK